MNTIETAALQAIRTYYLDHDQKRRDDPAGLSGPCECDGCRQARTFANLIGVNLAMPPTGGA